ncbi:glycoside hydrolase family 35 protein [Terriglobus tenax]|uniref:glycoside hydrolase family 35 protein n=1 Tax=Terriglobus tenax TaxID=1111115 RepID=UPI0021E05ECF|nr:beta-galactosidase family protein [Terriglobus tenax]
MLKLSRSRMLVAAIALSVVPPSWSTAWAAAPHSFTVQDGHFAKDGQPYRILSGEIHYARVPRAYWRQRLRMARAMGLNTITTYVFWNLHEPRPGVYDFSGQNDVAEFIREAQQEGLNVILRPGPYICAEWEFGGYPAWLLKQKDTVVRSSDPKFMEPVTRWMHRLGKELAPLQVGNGGPIIAVQVENEYGSFSDDHAYMEQIHHLVQESGFTKALLYTADGPEQVPNGSLPELPAVINFGLGGAQNGFDLLRKLRPNGPFMTGEYWAGWFDHWGDKHHTDNAGRQVADVQWILRQGYSISLYMFHGGTSFGWMNGANFTKGKYEPDVTSYDYDAPLDESGHPTQKFFQLRDVISKATGVTPPSVPDAPKTQALPAFTLSQSASLWQHLPAPVHSGTLLSMEDLDQAYGYILYRTTVPIDTTADLVLNGLHDYASIYADGKLLGTLDRRLNQDRLSATLKKGTQLDLLVENTGRVNFTTAMRGERKGILGSVQLGDTELHDWSIYSLPMQDNSTLFLKNSKSCDGPCFFRGNFRTTSSADTFLDVSNSHKGFVWVNGHPLGRIWSIGPQKALYLPGVWLRKGENEVVVFDLDPSGKPELRGSDVPTLGETADK